MTEVEVLSLQYEIPFHQQHVAHGDLLSEKEFINYVYIHNDFVNDR